MTDEKIIVPYHFKALFMSYNTYRALPLEGLYDLLCASIKDMLLALGSNDGNLIEIRTKQKQVEILLEVIEERKKKKVEQA